MKSPFGKVQVGEVRSSPVEKREAGSHQVEIKARSQKKKRLEKNFEDSPSKYILNGTKIINGGKFQIFKFSNVQNLGSRGPQGTLQIKNLLYRKVRTLLREAFQNVQAKILKKKENGGDA